MKKKRMAWVASLILSLSLAGALSAEVLKGAPVRFAPLGGVHAFNGKLPPLKLPRGASLDEAPTLPEPDQKNSVFIENFQFPLAAPTATGSPFDSGVAVLDVDPKDAQAVEKLLRARVDADRKYGVASSELKTVHVKYIAGQGDQADTVYAYFQQVKDGVLVAGAYLGFTIKVIKGRPVIVGTMANLYSNITVDTVARFNDDELKASAEKRLPAALTGDLEFVARKIIYTGGSWRSANLYRAENLPVMIAVDVATAQVFAWDGRHGVGDAPVGEALKGKAAGRGETSDTRPSGQPVLVEVPLPNLNISFDNGAKTVTDKEGRFEGQSVAGRPLVFQATLSGKRFFVHDKAGKPLKMSDSLKPGQEMKVVFNPAGADELVRSQVTVYLAGERAMDFLEANGIKDQRLKGPLLINVNIDEECNAFYDGHSINFFRSSRNCSDTAKPGVVFHEFGHWVDDMLGGIVNSGLSEGWGDILSMFILESPIIGDGFLKRPGPDGKTYIRHGENNYQYRDRDEEHDQGQAWMGFAWKFRKAAKAAFGEAAGMALSNTLIIPTLYAKAATIPAAMAQVLLNDMDKEGRMPHEAMIREAAKAHGVPLPKNPAVEAGLAGGTTQNPGVPTAGSVPPGPEVAFKKTFSAGLFTRGRVRAAVERYCKERGLKYKLDEVRHWFSSDFILEVEGSSDEILALFSKFQGYFKA